jgi:hypothetical protein
MDHVEVSWVSSAVRIMDAGFFTDWWVAAAGRR